MPYSRRALGVVLTSVLVFAGLVSSGSPASAASRDTTAASPAAAGDASDVAGTSHGPDEGSGSGRSRRYLLSLGDSLAFGYQSARVQAELMSGTYSPDHYPGYVEPLAARIRHADEEHLRVVNYGCPGETTASMISGPCGYAVEVHRAGYPRALHDDYSGSQLDAAVAFLRAHRGQVSSITVSLGANDLNNLFNGCNRDVACVGQKLPATLSALRTNLAVILAAVRSQAPHAQVIVLTPYNPAFVINPGTDALLTTSDGVIAAVARAGHARVADGFAAINLAIPGQELASICTFTLMCPRTPGAVPDIHPSDAGYLRLTDALWTASRDARRPGEDRAA